MKTKTISMISGKNGVGRTTLICNLACYLAKQGKKVLIFDAGMGVANIDIMFGISPSKGLYDVVSKSATLNDVLLEVTPRVWVIPCGSSFDDLQKLTLDQRIYLLEETVNLKTDFDYVLIDTASGISETTLHLSSACQEKMVVITPNPSSFSDSYALIKVLTENNKKQKLSVICNFVDDGNHGHFLFKKFNEVVFKFLNVSLDYAGSIPMDGYLRRGFHSDCLIMRQGQQRATKREIIRIGRYLESLSHDLKKQNEMGFFWNQVVGVA